MPAKKIPATTTPVHRDNRLNNRRGERWKDIPGLEGYFQVSSCGRIKRLEREMIYPDGNIYKRSEKIMLPKLVKGFNKLMQDYSFQLHAHLAMAGNKYHFSIRRLVYHCFVRPFRLDDSSVCIVSKKGDGLTISPGNLEMIDKSHLTQRIYDRKRMVSIFRNGGNMAGTHAAAIATGRQVSQYDKKGKKVKTFVSVSAAGRATGINGPSIGHAAHGLEPTAGGFFWRFGKEKTFDVKAFLAARKRAITEKRGTRVTQFDRQGTPIAHYISLRDAAEATKGSWTGISAAIRGVIKTAHGYRWKKGIHRKKIKPMV